MYCTAYSAGDWTMGYKSYNITFPSNTKAEIVYAWGDWVRLSNGLTPGWSVRAKIDTSVRSDIGVINSSPISASASAYCIRHGYSYQIVLPITDPNQSDDLRCRWSSLYPTDECDGICDYIVTISNLTFSKSSAGYQCVINFNSALAAASSSGGEILKSIISFIKTFNKCLSLLCSRYNV
jgi:hypothetical protein